MNLDAMLALALVVAIGVALRFRWRALEAESDARLWRANSEGFERVCNESQAQVEQMLEERIEYARERWDIEREIAERQA